MTHPINSDLDDDETATLSPIVLFSGDPGPIPGSLPLSGLLADGSGDLFGVTFDGGVNGGGEVYEIVNSGTAVTPDYAGTPNILASFIAGDDTVGDLPMGPLASDSLGDLFGTNSSGGANGDGVVFEIPKTSDGFALPKLVASLGGDDGAQPQGNLIVEANGDIFGEAASGGEYHDGALFEIEVDPSSPTGYDVPETVLSFSGDSGPSPGASPTGLISDASGDLFGTASNDGDDGSSSMGEVFELNTNGVFSVLASFDGNNGGNPNGLVADSKGDLFGTTSVGGALGDGTIYEIQKTATGYDDFEILAYFDGDDGAYPAASLIIDAAGNLYGTAQYTSSSGGGDVFELKANADDQTGYDNAPTLIANFAGAGYPDGASPTSALVADPAGDLLGTADFGGDNNGTVFEVTNSGFVDTIPCFRRGTRISTARGEVEVEKLRIGDLAVTASGTLRPILWLGNRRLDITKHPAPQSVWPVRIWAHAFDNNLPQRDLWLSPGHNIADEGALMPISALINGISITQIRQDQVEYWHVELPNHDVLLAEGLPSESYLDTGNRAGFANGDAFVEAHPDFNPKHWADTCLPLVTEGPCVIGAKARLIARLAELGHRVTEDADAHIVVDGLRVEPTRLSETQLAFALPPGGRNISLRSNTFIPAQLKPESRDVRELGVCVGRLEIDGETIALDDHDALTAGWREAEFADGFFARRWTSGQTPLPAGAKVVIVDLIGVGCYWRSATTNF